MVDLRTRLLAFSVLFAMPGVFLLGSGFLSLFRIITDTHCACSLPFTMIGLGFGGYLVGSAIQGIGLGNRIGRGELPEKYRLSMEKQPTFPAWFWAVTYGGCVVFMVMAVLAVAEVIPFGALSIARRALDGRDRRVRQGAPSRG